MSDNENIGRSVSAARKPRRFGWLLEEWVVQVLLVVAVVSVVVEALLSLGSGGPTLV